MAATDTGERDVMVRDVLVRDVLVLGGGPAGTAVAGLLARQGHDVLVLEREEFPRFRIGESLLPACLPVLEELGIESAPDTFVYKRGARFVCEATKREQAFGFDEALPGCPPHAWHVTRATFDTQLRDRARELGAEVRHGETVIDAGVDAEPSGQHGSGQHGSGPHAAWAETRDATGATRRFRARYLIDASGQSRLLARRADAVEHYSQFGHSAAFTHFANADTAELGPDFDIRIMLRAEGWGWIIPLPDRRVSIGMVSQGKMTREELDAGLLSGPLAQRLTRSATREETRVVGNFSYRNTKAHGARFAAAGDAACFLDPVFSSGVTLALRAAASIANVVGPALANGTEADPALLDEHHASMDRAYRTFAGLIERFYNSHFAETMFLGDNTDMELRSGVMSVLAGDVWRTGNPFQEMLLRARRRAGSVRA